MAEKQDRVRRTKQEWTKILRRFESSGVGPREFCQREGLPPSSFQRWRRRLASGASADFVDLTPPETPSATPDWELEVSLPNGVRLQFRG
jgi:transposase-like protein